MSATVDKDKCFGCAACTLTCPTFAILVKESKAEVDTELCISCGTCQETCEHGAIKLKNGKAGGGY